MQRTGYPAAGHRDARSGAWSREGGATRTRGTVTTRCRAPRTRSRRYLRVRPTPRCRCPPDPQRREGRARGRAALAVHRFPAARAPPDRYHVGCEHGICGACTILLRRQVGPRMPHLCRSGGRATTSRTVKSGAGEGVRSPLRQAFRDYHGLQCGYCTPGMIMTIVGLHRGEADPSEEEVRPALSGNLCRCTGYQHIVDAFRQAAEGHGARPVTDPCRKMSQMGQRFSQTRFLTPPPHPRPPLSSCAPRAGESNRIWNLRLSQGGRGNE